MVKNVTFVSFRRGDRPNLPLDPPLLQRGPTISDEQIKKSFKPNSMPKKLWVKISSKNFSKDLIK